MATPKDAQQLRDAIKRLRAIADINTPLIKNAIKQAQMGRELAELVVGSKQDDLSCVGCWEVLLAKARALLRVGKE